MNFVTRIFGRKTYTVHAIQVDNENLQEVADWTGGRALIDEVGYGTLSYVQVPTGQVNGRVQMAKAKIGDWVTCLDDPKRFRVYKNRAFFETFRPVDPKKQYADVYAIIVSAMRKQDAATYNGESDRGMADVADKAVRSILGLF